MRAAMFYEPGDVRTEDVPEPRPGEVLEGIKYEVRLLEGEYS